MNEVPYVTDEEDENDDHLVGPQLSPIGETQGFQGTSFERVRQVSAAKATAPHISNQFRIFLQFFIISNMLTGFLHVLLPSLVSSFYISTQSPSTYLRSNGILSLTLTILSLGITRSLQADIGSLTVLTLSFTFYCTATLSNLILAIVYYSGGALDVFGWLNTIFLVIWLLGLVEFQRRDRVFISRCVT
jgi:hypothetical protein